MIRKMLLWLRSIWNRILGKEKVDLQDKMHCVLFHPGIKPKKIR